jgi:hypothetical protein
MKSALDFRKYTKQIWLAGLGAFSRAEEEGNKLFDSDSSIWVSVFALSINLNS